MVNQFSYIHCIAISNSDLLSVITLFQSVFHHRLTDFTVELPEIISLLVFHILSKYFPTFILFQSILSFSAEKMVDNHTFQYFICHSQIMLDIIGVENEVQLQIAYKVSHAFDVENIDSQ
jgi:hypothetical protein